MRIFAIFLCVVIGDVASVELNRVEKSHEAESTTAGQADSSKAKTAIYSVRQHFLNKLPDVLKRKILITDEAEKVVLEHYVKSKRELLKRLLTERPIILSAYKKALRKRGEEFDNYTRIDGKFRTVFQRPSNVRAPFEAVKSDALRSVDRFLADSGRGGISVGTKRTAAVRTEIQKLLKTEKSHVTDVENVGKRKIRDVKTEEPKAPERLSTDQKATGTGEDRRNKTAAVEAEKRNESKNAVAEEGTGKDSDEEEKEEEEEEEEKEEAEGKEEEEEDEAEKKEEEEELENEAKDKDKKKGEEDKEEEEKEEKDEAETKKEEEEDKSEKKEEEKLENEAKNADVEKGKENKKEKEEKKKGEAQDKKKEEEDKAKKKEQEELEDEAKNEDEEKEDEDKEEEEEEEEEEAESEDEDVEENKVEEAEEEEKEEDEAEIEDKEETKEEGDEEPGACGQVKTELKAKDIKVMVDTHNECRRREKAADMLEIVWDKDIAEIAQVKASTCEYGHSMLKDCKGRGLGQSIWANWNFGGKKFVKLNYTEVTYAWADENKDWDYSLKTCNAGKVCGHWQILTGNKVWRLGCGSSRCKRLKMGDNGQNKANFVVCDYFPFVNVFTEGEHCSKCENGTKCENELCAYPKDKPSPEEEIASMQGGL